MPDHPTRRPRHLQVVSGEVVAQAVPLVRPMPEQAAAPTVYMAGEIQEHPGPIEWPPLPLRAVVSMIAVVWTVTVGLGLLAGGLWLGVFLVVAVIASLVILAQT